MRSSFQRYSVLVIILFYAISVQAQKGVTGKEAEYLWASYDHNRFQDELRQELGISTTAFDHFQKYLILQKKTSADKMVFFNKLLEGCLKPSSIGAWFAELKTKYLLFYPEFLIYQSAPSTSFANAENRSMACGSGNNPGFETGDFTGWVQKSGNAVTGIGLPGVTLAIGNSQTSITKPGIDPVVGSALPSVFPGGSHSAMIGDTNKNGANAGGLSTSFIVNSSNINYTYSYAIVLQDGGHQPGDQPFFMVNVSDQNGNNISSASLYVVAGANASGFTTVSGTTDQYYRPWTSVILDLSAYKGQCISIDFICRDCTQGGHYGYAYIDGASNALMITPSSDSLCSGGSITLTAASGGATYSWSGPGIIGANNTQLIAINAAGTYSCAVTNGSTTSSSITVPAKSGTAPTVIASGGMAVCPNTNDTLHTTGATSYSWYPTSTLNNPIAQNPIARTSTTTTYIVTGSIANGCSNTASTTTTVYPSPNTPIISFNAPYLYSNASFGNQWYLNGTLINGATSNQYQPLSSGNYIVIVTDFNGCVISSQPYSYTSTGISQLQIPARTLVFPNPFQDKTTIRFNEGGIHYIELTDLRGRQLQYHSCSEAELNLSCSDLKPGSYIIRISDSEHRLISVSRILME